MLLEKPITEVIKSRCSVRTYQERPLSPEVRERLAQILAEAKGPFGLAVRFKLMDREAARRESDVKLGTYGVIRGATSFIAGVAAKGEKDLEELGYALEWIILQATALGLGTCWLGGSFKKSEFARAMELAEDEILPAVTPVGYPGGRRSLIDSLMRFAAGSRNRKSWEELFFKNDFHSGLSRTEAGQYAEALDMVRFAPSASNKQPWRIVADQGKYHFYLQHTRGYAKMMAYDIQRIDAGIAMCHFELTAREAGIRGKWTVRDPGITGLPELTEYLVSWVEE